MGIYFHRMQDDNNPAFPVGIHFANICTILPAYPVRKFIVRICHHLCICSNFQGPARVFPVEDKQSAFPVLTQVFDLLTGRLHGYLHETVIVQ